MYPGEMQLTRMPACAHSTAREAARWRTAAFALLYGLEVSSSQSTIGEGLVSGPLRPS